MDCLKCGNKLWGSADTAECVNDYCSTPEDETTIPVALVWGLVGITNPQWSNSISIEPIPFEHGWQRCKYKGAVQEVRDEQKNQSNN